MNDQTLNVDQGTRVLLVIVLATIAGFTLWFFLPNRGPVSVAFISIIRNASNKAANKPTKKTWTVDGDLGTLPPWAAQKG